MTSHEEEIPKDFRVIEYPFHMGDLIGGTAHLTNAQFGAYMRIILAMIQKPDGMRIEEIRSHSRVQGRYWADFWVLIGNKFVDKDGIITHKRVRETVRKIARKSSQNRDNVLKRHNSDSTDVLPKDNKRSTNHSTNKPYKESLSRYDVNIFLKNTDHDDLRRRFCGWDISYQIEQFNQFIRKKGERPAYPMKALCGFIEKNTKGKSP